jgi:Cu/Ag efflux protein CusF
MKRSIAAGIALAVVLLFGVAAFADEPVKVKGTVTKIDEAAKSVTIQPKEGEAITVVMEDGDLLSKVKEGGKGQATYAVVDGKNVGTKLKKLSAGCD